MEKCDNLKDQRERKNPASCVPDLGRKEQRTPKDHLIVDASHCEDYPVNIPNLTGGSI